MDIKLCLNYFNSFLFILIFIVSSTFSYGFDSATSCNPKTARRGRAQLLASIPCDLTQQAYCNLPGSQYPWHAVRRFVHENQGLMKRMYGDIRHISILRSEIHNNEIDIEDYEATASRYSRNSNDFKNRRHDRYLQSEFQNSKSNDVLSEPHFRPTTPTATSITTTTITSETITATTATPSSTTSTTKNPSQISPTSPSASTPSSTQDLNAPQHNFENIVDQNKSDQIEFRDSLDNNLESNNDNSSTISAVNNESKNIVDNIKIVQSPNLASNKSETATISTTLKVVQQIIQSEIESEKATEKSSIPDTEIINEQKSNGSDDEQQQQNSIENNIDQNTETVQIIYKNHQQEQHNEIIQEKNNSIVPEGISKQQQQYNEGFIEKKKINKPNTIESQLFQDTIQKDTPAILNLRGINACPVKEEVVAPFWANNTRGEVLALLNLYPFEQYVHWEKCTHENKQMYCRDGCRCEQQYRLHRLLAYDPHNECRGIFSDWFRFPSCCICKCYDIPLDFRATSRSPRTSMNDADYNDVDNDSGSSSSSRSNDNNNNKVKRHPIDVAEDELQRAIYEHAAEDWYRPRDEFDYLYDLV